MAPNPYNVWLALIAVLGFALIAPIIYNYVLPEVRQYATHIQFLVGMVPVMMLVLLVVSWLQPEAI